MKKILFLLMVIGLSLTSCDSDETNQNDHGCNPDQIYVEGYTKADGTYVNGYCRTAHNK